MSIASEIARLQQAKADLKTAINNKGGNITTEKIDQFASKVTALPTPKEEETKTLTPNFTSGNQVITPTSGKVLSQVTLTKPTDLLPENIAKDKNICGVVGTLESGSGGGLASGNIYLSVGGPASVTVTIGGINVPNDGPGSTTITPLAEYGTGEKTISVSMESGFGYKCNIVVVESTGSIRECKSTTTNTTTLTTYIQSSYLIFILAQSSFG